MKTIHFRGETFRVPSINGHFVCLSAYKPNGELVEQRNYWTQFGLVAAQSKVDLFAKTMNKDGAVIITAEVRNDDDNRLIGTYESNRPVKERWHLPEYDINGSFVRWHGYAVAA